MFQYHNTKLISSGASNNPISKQVPNQFLLTMPTHDPIPINPKTNFQFFATIWLPLLLLLLTFNGLSYGCLPFFRVAIKTTLCPLILLYFFGRPDLFATVGWTVPHWHQRLSYDWYGALKSFFNLIFCFLIFFRWTNRILFRFINLKCCWWYLFCHFLNSILG